PRPHNDIPSDIHTCDRMPDRYPCLLPATRPASVCAYASFLTTPSAALPPGKVTSDLFNEGPLSLLFAITMPISFRLFQPHLTAQRAEDVAEERREFPLRPFAKTSAPSTLKMSSTMTQA